MGKILERLEMEYFLAQDFKPNKQEKIIDMPLKALKLNPDRVRKSINREEIALMAANIKRFGLLQPIEINEKNEVILGNRRFEAAKLACLDSVPCIRRSSSDLLSIEKQLVSDLHSKHLSVLERAIAFKRLLELSDMSKYALANYLGLSHNLVCRTLSILECNKNTFKLMKQGKISQKKVAMIMYRLKDKSLEDFVVKEIIDKQMNIIQAGNFIAEINNPEIFKKHFLMKIRGFKTSLNNFKEKLKFLDLDDKIKKEIKQELKDIDFKKLFE